MTFSHFSKDLIRPLTSGDKLGDSVFHLLSTTKIGVVPEGGGGMIVFRFDLFRFPFFLHATRCGKGGGNSREDGDYHVEDLAPKSVVVESSHFK